MRRIGGVAAALLLAVGACGDGDGVRVERAPDATTTTAAPAPTATTGPTGTTVAPVPAADWEDCGAAQCTTVPTPVDHDEPAGPTVDLFVTRLPATGERIGPLFVNFGGPGGVPTETVARYPFPAAVRERFDIVAVDPRGVGRSAPLDCGLPPAELYSVDPTVDDAADALALVDVSQRYADDCARVPDGLLAEVGTADVARDLDRVRAALGDEQLSYLGFSYGTSIGQAYAEQFPRRVRAMALDGVVDPAPPGIDVAVQQAVGFESALADWAAACGSRRSCPFGDRALDAVDDLLVRAEDGIAAGGGNELGPGEAVLALAYPLYSSDLWDDLDRAVAAALDGDAGGMLDLARDYFVLVEFAPYFAVSCLDSTWPDSAEEHLAAARDAARHAPRFGEAIVNDYLRCALWAAEPEPLGPIAAPGAPPILVVSTTGDPATPHAGAVAVADRLASAVLLTHEGDGHTIVFQGSGCVDAIATDYLVDLVVPPEGARC